MTTTEQSELLPTPRDFPQSDIVVYDGNCQFCTNQVRNLLRFDGQNRLSFISLHDPLVAERFPDLSHDQLMEQMYLIPGPDSRQHEKRFAGAAAIRYLTVRLPKLWVFAPLLHIPFTLPIWQWLYRQVAQRRYQIANRTGEACDDESACKLHIKQ